MKNMIFEKQGLSLTFNHGKTVVDDATITLEWEVNESLCRLKPKYALVIVQDDNNRGAHSIGRRYLVKMSDKVTYLQFHKSGKHLVYFLTLNPLAFSEEDYRKLTNVEERRKANYGYRKAIYANELDTACDSANSIIVSDDISGLFTQGILVAQKMEVEMPDGFFSSKPKTGVWLMIYNMINAWRKFDPLDDCEQRKRAIIFFITVFPFLIVSLWRLGMFIAAAFMTLGIVLLRVLTFMVGFRPVHLLTGVKDIWSEYMIWGRFGSFNHRLWKYKGWSHRVWKTELNEVGDDEYEKVKRLPFSPFGISVLTLLVGILISYWHSLNYIQTLLILSWIGLSGTNILFRILKVKYPNFKYSQGPWDMINREVIVACVLVTLLTFYWFWFPLIGFIVAACVWILAVIGVCILGIITVRYRKTIASVLVTMVSPITVPLDSFMSSLLDRYRQFARHNRKTVRAAWVFLGLVILLFTGQRTGKALGAEGVSRMFEAIAWIVGCTAIAALLLKFVPVIIDLITRTKWYQAKEVERDIARQKKEHAFQETEEVRKQRLEAWRNGVTIVPEPGEGDCEICEDRTVLDTVRLTANKLKPKVCKPYSQ